MRRELGAAYGDKERDQATALAKRLKKKHETQIVPAEQRGTFGGLATFCEAKKMSTLEGNADFGQHRAFVCGEPKINAAAQASVP